MQRGNSPLLTEDQQKWVESQVRAMNKPLKRAANVPTHLIRRKLHAFVESDAFDIAIMVLIVINTIIMAMEHYDQGPAWDEVQRYSNIIFTAVFAAEAILKLAGLGIKTYFSRPGNCFDFFLVLVSILGIVFGTGVVTNFMRLFRIARVFRLIKSLKVQARRFARWIDGAARGNLTSSFRHPQGLRILFTTLIVSIPTMLNVAGLGFLLLFMYAVTGVNFFGRIKYGPCCLMLCLGLSVAAPHLPCATRYGEELDRHANFRNFGTALLLLLRIITGEAWNGIMHDCMVQPPDCDPSSEPYCAVLDDDGGLQWNTTSGSYVPVAAPGVAGQAGCTCDNCSWRELYDIDNCGVRWAPVYFVSFFILGAFVMLNLVIAVVLENFSSSKKSGDSEVRPCPVADERGGHSGAASRTGFCPHRRSAMQISRRCGRRGANSTLGQRATSRSRTFLA